MAVSKKEGELTEAQLLDKFTSQAETEYADTGSVILNSVMSGQGCPRGTFTEITAPFGVGKSTLCIHVSKTFCVRGEDVYYLDYEKGVNEKQMTDMGIMKYLYDPIKNPTGKFHLLYPVSFEDADEIFKSLLTSKPGLVIIDSAPAIVPGKLLDKGIEEIEPGLEARMMSNFLKKYKSHYGSAKISVFIINQVRTQIRFRGSTTVEPAGGMALKFYCDIRLMLELDKKLEKTMQNMSYKESVAYGSVLKLWSMKNRWAPPFIPLSLSILFGKGVSNIFSYIEFFTQQGLITKGSSGVYTITFPDMEVVKVRGLPLLQDWISTNIKVVRKLCTDMGGFQLKATDVEDD